MPVLDWMPPKQVTPVESIGAKFMYVPGTSRTISVIRYIWGTEHTSANLAANGDSESRKRGSAWEGVSTLGGVVH